MQQLAIANMRVRTQICLSVDCAFYARDGLYLCMRVFRNIYSMNSMSKGGPGIWQIHGGFI